MSKNVFFLLFFATLLGATAACGQDRQGTTAPTLRPETTDKKSHWVDSVYQQLSFEERIGQLFMVAAYSGGESFNKAEIDRLIANHQIGGIIFMQGTPEAQARLTNHYQQSAQVPLLIGMDGEWGLGMRLTGVTDYPKQMMMGATHDPELMYEMATAIAQQCKRLGVNIDFAPVVDVNNNPQNPVINFRSFGDDKQLVAKMGIAYMKGLQDHGVLACAKHFPGHGDVSVDSHKDLPVINKTAEQLWNLELYPFRQLIESGISSIMIAHLEVPALETKPHLPTTLSKKVVTGLLRDSMGFDGLIITDALNMRGVTKYFPDGETDLKAFLAGNDILLFSQDVPLAISKIRQAIESGVASRSDLEHRVKKILAAKYDVGLAAFQPVKTTGVTEDLNKQVAHFKEAVAEAAVTLVADRYNLLTRLQQGDGSIGYISINGDHTEVLGASLQKAIPQLERSSLPSGASRAKAADIAAQYATFDAVVVGIHDLSLYPGRGGSYGLDAAQLALINQLEERKNVIFVVFGNAYLMKYLCDASGAIVAYEDDPYTEKAAFQVIMGSLQPHGRLPVHICP